MSNETDNNLGVAIPNDLPEDISQGVRSHGKIRRVVVDRQACIGARSCALVAALSFKMDDENLAYVADTLDQDDDETIEMGAQSCPVLAIHLYDKEGNKLFPEV